MPGVRIVQEGRRIRMENTQTPEQAAETRERIQGLQAELPNQIDRQVEELRAYMRSLPTLQLLANLALAVVVYDPETYKELRLNIR